MPSSEAARGRPSISFVVVTWRCAGAVRRSLAPLAAELEAGDQLIVVDNDSADDTVAAVREAAPAAEVIEAGSNLGFGAACNLGAASADGELLVFLNPDAAVEPGFADAIARPLADGRGWGAWQGLVTQDEGRSVNSRGGAVHFTSIAWAGGAGEPIESLPADLARREPGFASGACRAVPARVFARLGGFCEHYFLYHEDVDLSLRIRLLGAPLGVVFEARCDHAYEFDKGPAKWRQLERNRHATVIRCYPAALLVTLAPALLATEVALLLVAARGGWLAQKLRALADSARALPGLIRERREIQARRVVPASEFATALTAELDSGYLGRAAGSRTLRLALRSYWSLALALVGGSPAPARPAEPGAG